MKRRTFLDLAALSALAPVPRALGAEPSAPALARDPRAPARGARAGSCRSTPRRAGARQASGSSAPGRAAPAGPAWSTRARSPSPCRRSSCSPCDHDLPPETRLYGESFQMLTQTGGTLGRARQPRLRRGQALQDAPAGRGQPRGHRPAHAHARPAASRSRSPGAPCRRFVGRFYLRPGALEGVLDAEGLAIGAGRDLGPRGARSSPPAPRASRCSAQLAERINQQPPAAQVRQAADRLVLLVLLRAARDRASR